jgi:Domain of unknown function (DUF4201)
MDAINALRSELHDLEAQNAALERENGVMRGFYTRVVLGGKASGEDASRARALRRGRGALQTLTAEQKLEVVQGELDEALRRADGAETHAQQTVDTIRAMTAHVETRLGEVRKERHEFERSVVRGAVDERTNQAQAESAERWMEEKVHQRATLVDKLRLKARALRALRRKLQQQVVAKEEMGDVLHYIDYHQLQIENKQYLARIEERNAELLQLKVATGRAMQALNDRRTRLSELERGCARLRAEIATRSELRERLRQEHTGVESDVEGARRDGSRLDAASDDSASMPGILDYAVMQREFEELAKEVVSWERKLEVAQVGARQAVRKQREAQAAAATASIAPYQSLEIARELQGLPTSSSTGAAVAAARHAHAHHPRHLAAGAPSSSSSAASSVPSLASADALASTTTPLVRTRTVPHAAASARAGRLVSGRLMRPTGTVPPNI